MTWKMNLSWSDLEKMMNEWKWCIYPGGVQVNPDDYQPPASRIGVVLFAQCISRNGYLGCAWLCYEGDGGMFYVEAGSEDTGRMWKSPNNLFPTLKEAAEAAQKLWRPI